ncbi:MAG: universal stress protein [Rhodospirillales bacterium]|nr:universal stress protein [Rhodospirillales bacterium]
MAIRSILIPLDGAGGDHPAMVAGFKAAGSQSAHITVLHMRPDPKESVPLLGEGMSGTMIEEMIDLAEKEGSDRATRAKAVYEDFRGRFGFAEKDQASGSTEPTVSWVEDIGREDEATAWRGRLHDLIVIGRNGEEWEASATLTLNAALFESGRPVLVAPSSIPETIGRKITISWNGSPEAARAVSAAIPFIAGAEQVTVVTADTDRTPVSAASELAAYLAWHGISAGTQTLSQSNQSVGEALLEKCAGSDLLVMGAYTHSRLRQLILGGVTRHVLSAAQIPVLMSH